MEKRKALVVSSTPFSRSNRGIDIITQTLVSSGFDTTHLTFASKHYLRSFPKPANITSDITQKRLEIGTISYNETLMHKWNKRFVKQIIRHSIKHLRFDFRPYDIIIIESGKPVLLLPLLPENKLVVYRQSDPMSSMFKNPVIHEAERAIIRRADRILCVRNLPGGQLLYGEPDTKVSVIANGFDIDPLKSCRLDNEASETNGSKHAVYVGYTPIDGNILISLARKYPNVIFHIIGDCLDRHSKKRIRIYENVVLYGNKTSEEYLPIVAKSNLAIVPFAKADYLAGIGLNSKFLMFMYFGLPIISIDIGCKDEFPTTDSVIFCETKGEFINAFDRMLKENTGKCEYDIDFESYSKDGRVKEYRAFFESL